MAEKAITINTAPEAEAHIFAQDDAAIFHSILGGASGILPGESLMPATKISNNLVRIGPGVFSNQGYMIRIATGDYKDLTIDSGTAGMNRYDLIVAEFTRVGAVDSHILKVVKGTATSGTPADPTLTQQNLDQSGTVRQEPLYRVRLSGTTLTQIDLLATQLPNLNLVQVELSGKVSLSRYIQTTITPGQSIVVEVIGGGNAILSTSFNLQTSRSVVLALSGNATNSTQKASIHSLVSGSDIAYSVETPSNWNRITVKNNGSYPIIFQAQGIGASLVSLI